MRKLLSFVVASAVLLTAGTALAAVDVTNGSTYACDVWVGKTKKYLGTGQKATFIDKGDVYASSSSASNKKLKCGSANGGSITIVYDGKTCKIK